MRHHIFHHLQINASAKKVFQAVSNPSHLENWWPQKCHGREELGGLYRLFFTIEYDWLAEVDRYEPNRAFHMKMIKSDEDWASTSFGFDLEEVGNATKVHFWHKDWPELNEHYMHSNYCWALLLKGLKDYVEEGVIIPFEKRS